VPPRAEVGKAFATHYYQTFDTNRAALQTLYKDGSMLTFENDQFMGMQQIMTKLTVRAPPCPSAARPRPAITVGCWRAAQTLNFKTVQHQASTIDSQPTPTTPGGILTFVTGKLVVDGSPNPLNFAQSFHLLPTPEGGWYIHNDLFRLNC
jgi:hypothetical protein